MKILVCGGRDYNEQEYVFYVLNLIHEQTPITCVVHDDASGADSLGQAWAKENQIKEKPYPADWTTWKHAAGPRRNAEMLRDNPDIELVIVFPGGRGTRNMRNKAERAGIKTFCL